MADATATHEGPDAAKDTSTPLNNGSDGTFNGRITSTSRPFSSQEPWNMLFYWMSAQYYQQYYYQLCSYMYYWQTLASHPMYQGAFQTQSVDPQTSLNQQGAQAVFGGQQPQNIQQNRTAPWLNFQARQPAVRTVMIWRDTHNDNTSLKDIEELLIQALVYRLIVFAFEVFFLMGGLHGSVGGATPGKYLMGLSVVATETITTVAPGFDGDRVRIEPGGNLGFRRSFLRALVKNFSMTFLFPVFLTILFFQHNRTIYDVIANSTVVVTGSPQPRQAQDRHQ
ncbi:hypothetical protein pdam_00011793 [Pocillopora damicornis]|uniref:RDD domain-containing protein n=1 Tax=Pocillopora damicornis TaxID=46731 RepID=A0A3M6U2B3_POCDA|nr:hypothetical protein pdam_00011793 [Pocillopora damicornis]